MKKLTKHIHHRLFHDSSAFALATVAAYLVWVGDLLCVIGDLVWLFGDMHIQVHPHHYYVLAILSTAFILIASSGVWLYWAIDKYLRRKASRSRLRSARHVRAIGINDAITIYNTK